MSIHHPSPDYSHSTDLPIPCTFLGMTTRYHYELPIGGSNLGEVLVSPARTGRSDKVSCNGSRFTGAGATLLLVPGGMSGLLLA